MSCWDQTLLTLLFLFSSAIFRLQRIYEGRSNLLFQLLKLKLSSNLCISRSFPINTGSTESNTEPSASHQYPKTSGEPLPPIMDVLASPVTNEVAMELQLLAELANDIFGTGQVFSAGRNLTPLNGTALSGEKKGCGWARHAGATALVHMCVCVCVGVCVLVYYYIWKDLLESRTLEENSKIYIKNEGVLRHQSRDTLTHSTWWTDKLHVTFFGETVIWFKSPKMKKAGFYVAGLCKKLSERKWQQLQICLLEPDGTNNFNEAVHIMQTKTILHR